MRVEALTWVGLSKGAHERRGSMMVHEKAKHMRNSGLGHWAGRGSSLRAIRDWVGVVPRAVFQELWVPYYCVLDEYYKARLSMRRTRVSTPHRTPRGPIWSST